MENHDDTTRKHNSTDRLSSLELGETTPLRLFVWHVRRKIRDLLGGSDVLNIDDDQSTRKSRAREVYRSVDAFMAAHLPKLVRDTPLTVARNMVHDQIIDHGYLIVEEDLTKPWGAYYRMASDDAERFVEEFFPDLSMTEARLGRSDVELSPKFLLVAPGHRLSWQYHDRRAERWRFLTPGGYYRSHDDDMPDILIHGKAGEVVQFDAGERHRLTSQPHSKNYTLVAEIWQHTDAKKLSDEDDIVRLKDDYKR